MKRATEQKLRRVIQTEIKKVLKEDLSDEFKSDAKKELDKYLPALKEFKPKFKKVEGSGIVSYFYQLILPNENEETCLFVDYGLTDKFDTSRHTKDGEVFINYWPMQDTKQNQAFFKLIQNIKMINPNLEVILDDGFGSFKLSKIKTIDDLEKNI